jgi:stage IV sporulation protein A
MNIYKDIETRTNGEIYIGVVGPVRTGKSTFIKRFMELMVLPAIADDNNRKRAMDELPQSAAGKTVMTTEPKFIPKEAVEVLFEDGVHFKCRMIDCVGYMVQGAEGHEEDGKERLVKTPWFDYDIPFTKAAEIGTKKVIYDHSTVGIVVTCDDTISELDRSAYIQPETQTIQELKTLGKPFIVILNTRKPASPETLELAQQMEAEYGVGVLPINCDQLRKADVVHIFEALLLDFPVTCVKFDIPKWVEALDMKDAIKQKIVEKTNQIFSQMYLMKDATNYAFVEDEYLQSIEMQALNLADGSVEIRLVLKPEYYYAMLSEIMGEPIQNEYDFMKAVKSLAATKSQCAKVSTALMQSFKTGYGSVTPDAGDIRLGEPEIIKSGNKFGVKLTAQAPSIHLIKANITTEIAPIVGSEEQAKDLIAYIHQDGEKQDDIWDVNIFGKTVRQLVEDGLSSKVNKITQESQQKLQDTMEKIVNDSNGGMVCIII